MSRLNYNYIQTQKSNLPPEYEWTQQFTVQQVGKRENMWWLLNNTPSFTLATLKDHACRHKSLAASCWILHASWFLQLSSFMCVLMSNYVKIKLSTVKCKKTTYSLNVSEHSSSQCSKWGKGENMWRLLNNTPFSEHACRQNLWPASSYIKDHSC